MSQAIVVQYQYIILLVCVCVLQTLYLSEDIMLCDCPGLVFPAFVTTKQEMIISGILPIDQVSL